MLKPVPETVLLALSVVNAPVLAVVPPTGVLLIEPVAIVAPLIVGLVKVLLVRVCVPVRVVTVESIENAVPVRVRPVLAVYVCDPLNWANTMPVVPNVIVPTVVITKELPLLTVPFWVKKYEFWRIWFVPVP